jgi:hypothetical protein
MVLRIYQMRVRLNLHPMTSENEKKVLRAVDFKMEFHWGHLLGYQRGSVPRATPMPVNAFQLLET